MFTGIVEELGRVVALEPREGLLRIATESAIVHAGAQLGDSIAVNGVCLTVVAIDGARLAFEAVPETLRKTNLGRLALNDAVNLERPVATGRPMGGHYVQGHVDTTLTITSVAEDGEAREVWFAPSERALLRYVVPKGFVAIDGASLTVVDVREDAFSVTLVPHTQTAVTFGRAEPGHVANLEVDVMAKYVERSIAGRLQELEARLHALESAR